MGEGLLSVAAGRVPSGRVGSEADSATELLFADAGLVRQEDTLYLGDVSLTEIAKQVGTPAYVYNAEAIRSRFRSLDGALGSLPHRICFAVKANSNLGILRILRDLGAAADIVRAF